MIADLGPKIIIHDMAFDETGTRIALACNDKTVKIYRKNEGEWQQESLIKMVGAAGWKVKWAHSQYGVMLAVCSLDRILAIYEWVLLKKSTKEKYEWSMTESISNFSVEDFKFAPGGNKYGLTPDVLCSLESSRSSNKNI